MIQAWLWAILILLFGCDNKIINAQNFDHHVSVVSYAGHVAQNSADHRYQQQSLGAAVGQWVQDNVRIKTPASNFNSSQFNLSRFNSSKLASLIKLSMIH